MSREYLCISYHGRMTGQDEECDLLGYERMFAKEIPCWIRLWLNMGKWYMGQTHAMYEVSEQWIKTFKRLLWINCGSIVGQDKLMEIDEDIRFIHWNENSLMHDKSAYDIGRTNKGDVIAGNKVGEYNSECIVFRPEIGTIKDLRNVRGIITSWVEMSLTLNQ